MTYEERQRYRGLTERAKVLRARLAEGAGEAPLTRAEGRELLALVEGCLERMSPERWDRALDAVAEEAARRAGAMTLSREG